MSIVRGRNTDGRTIDEAILGTWTIVEAGGDVQYLIFLLYYMFKTSYN